MRYTVPENNNLVSFECYPEEWNNKISGYSFNTFTSDDFKAPSKYYYRNAFGDMVFFKAHRRKKANEMLKELEGVGKYQLRTVIKARVC